MSIFSSWKWTRRPTWKIVGVVEAADEIPTLIPKEGAILVGSLTEPKWLVFDCPCNVGHRIMVTLDRAHWPHWVVLDDKKLTVYPSFDYRTNDRRCHYVIWKGKVFWVPEGKGWI